MQKEVPAPPDPAEPLVAPERTLVMPVAGASAAFQASASADRRMWLAGGVALAAMALAGCASRPARPVASGGTGGAVGSTGGRRTPPTPAPATQAPLDLDPAAREASVAQAMLLVNTPYRYGGNTPEGGFDCSGLVQYVYARVAAGTARLPRTTAQWAAATAPVSDAGLQRGDLVFFNTTGTPFSHMGIYVGNDQFVHAPSSGGTVRRDSLNNRYFAPRYLGGRRVFAA